MSSLNQQCTLVPIDFSKQDEWDELLSQRQKCGWDSEPEKLKKWQKAMDLRTKSLFWIVIPSEANAGTTIRAGHISLDSHADPPDLDLANPDKSVLTIATFFIWPEYQSKGLGSTAMALVEKMATQEPYGSRKCRAIAVNTFNGKFYYRDSDEAHDFWEEPRRQFDQKRSNIPWYQKMGYRKWKQEPRYHEELSDGTKILLGADFLRKELS